jgi:uncharacterized protein
VVLFPHVALPLHIFEPRYRKMTEDALAADRLVAMVQVRPEAIDEKLAKPAIEEIACLGKIVSHERLPDGRFYFLLLGLKRIRILHEIDAPTPYRQAEVELLSDDDRDAYPEGERGDLENWFREVAERTGGLDPDLETVIRGGPPLGVLTDLMAHALQLPPTLKQLFLADPKPARRAATLRGILRQVLDTSSAVPRRPFPPPFSLN